MIEQLKQKFLESNTEEEWYEFINENQYDLTTILLRGDSSSLTGLLEDSEVSISTTSIAKLETVSEEPITSKQQFYS